MHRQPLLHMILALALVAFVGALVVGVAAYPQTVIVKVEAPPDGGTSRSGGYRAQEVACPGPLRRAEPVSVRVAEQVVVWPRDGSPCTAERTDRQAGTWLVIALSTLAAATALALLRRAGPAPDLDPPQPDPITYEVPE